MTGKSKKEKSAFKPPYSHKEIWHDAVNDCAKLMKKSNKERLDVATKLWENKGWFLSEEPAAFKKALKICTKKPLNYQKNCQNQRV